MSALRLIRFPGTLLLMILGLGSCVSVNSVRLTSDQTDWMSKRAKEIEAKAARIAQEQPDQSPVAVIQASGNTCPLYKLPALPKEPSVPISAIRALKEGDDEKLDVITQNYTKQLKTYSQTLRDTVTHSYQDYLRNCVKNLPSNTDSSSDGHASR